MTTLVSIIVAAVALSNICAVLYLVVTNNRMAQRGPEETKPPEKESAPESAEENPPENKPAAGIGKSRLDYSQIQAAVQAAVATVIPYAIKVAIGDVRPEDVVFDDDENVESPAEPSGTERAQPKKSATLDSKEIDEAFNDNRIDDADPDIVSPVGARCATMTEIEDSVNTAINPDATPEQQATAGKILNAVKDTELIERLMEDKEIEKGVMRCIKESFRAEMSERNKPRQQLHGKRAYHPAPAAERKFTIASDVESFNPADLI